MSPVFLWGIYHVSLPNLRHHHPHLITRNTITSPTSLCSGPHPRRRCYCQDHKESPASPSCSSVPCFCSGLQPATLLPSCQCSDGCGEFSSGYPVCWTCRSSAGCLLLHGSSTSHRHNTSFKQNQDKVIVSRNN